MQVSTALLIVEEIVSRACDGEEVALAPEKMPEVLKFGDGPGFGLRIGFIFHPGFKQLGTRHFLSERNFAYQQLDHSCFFVEHAFLGEPAAQPAGDIMNEPGRYSVTHCRPGQKNHDEQDQKLVSQRGAPLLSLAVLCACSLLYQSASLHG